jgi:hypothetical protein
MGEYEIRIIKANGSSCIRARSSMRKSPFDAPRESPATPVTGWRCGAAWTVFIAIQAYWCAVSQRPSCRKCWEPRSKPAAYGCVGQHQR